MNIWTEGNEGEGRHGLNYLFGNGILEFIEKGKSFLAVNEGFYEADSGETKGIFRVHTGQGNTKERRLGTKSEVRTFSPNLGLLNADKTVVLSKWLASRQYVRVLNRDTLHMDVMYSKVLKDLNFSVNHEIQHAYPQLLHPAYPNVQKALADVLSGNVLARAFSNKFFLANSPYSDNVVLGYKDQEIGEYLEQTGTVQLYDEFVDKADEVRQYFKI